MTDDLDEAARERAEQVREKRHDRADPEGRVGRVRDHAAPPEELDLPGDDPEGGGDPSGDDSADDVELPEPVREEFETVRKKLTYGLEQEAGVDLDAEAHYWPLVVHLGVERLKGMWLEEVEETLETTEGIEPPE